MSVQETDVVRSQAEVQVARIRQLFRFDMLFLLIVPSIFIFLSSGYLAPLFIIAVFPVMLLFLLNVILLSINYFKLKRLGRSELFSEAGRPLVLLMLMILTIPVGGIGYANRGDYFENNYNERAILFAVSSAIDQYAQEHNGKYPSPDNWFQELFQGNVPGWLDSEMNVVLNPEALKLGSEKPAEMVLGFVCYNGQWGQVGIYDEKVHDVGKILHYFSGKYGERMARTDQSQYLQWDKDKKQKPRNDNEVLIILVPLIAVVIYTIARARKYLRRHILLMFGIGLLSTISGGLFFSWATILFEGGSPGRFMGLNGLGSILGIIFSWIFVLWMAEYRSKCVFERCTYWVTLYGAIVGIICSCVVHTILLLVYKEFTLYPMLAGVPFGAWSGMLLGWWTGIALDRRNAEKEIAGH